MSGRSKPLADRTLGSYGRFVQRHAVLVLIFALLGAGAASIYILRTPVSYRATATVVASILPATSADEDLDTARRRSVSIDSDAQVARSTRVVRYAASATGFPGGYEALDDALIITAIPNSRILRLRVTAPSPLLARDAAAAIGDRFLDIRTATIEGRRQEEQAVLEDQIAVVNARLAALQVQPTTSEASLALEETRLTEQLADLEQELSRKLAEPIDPGFVAQPPALPTVGGRSNVPGLVVSGMLCGVLMALLIAAASEARKAAVPRRWRPTETSSPVDASSSSPVSARRELGDYQLDT